MEASSTTSTSASTGRLMLRPKLASTGRHSSRRCSVAAGRPVVSDSRLAARPVGAASATCRPACDRICTIPRTMVVLPTPGPPVITTTWLRSTWRIASACCRASTRFASRWYTARAASTASSGTVTAAAASASRMNPAATARSAR